MTDSPRRGSVLVAYALLLLAAASWGGNWVAARSAIGEVPPITLVFWRWLLASALLVAISIPHLRRDAATLRAHWRAVVGLGVIGTTAFSMLGYIGLGHTTATNATLLNGAMPIYQIPLSWLLLGLTISARQGLGLGLSLAGVLVILTRSELSVLTGLQFNPGDLIVLMAMFCWALYTVFLSRTPKVHPLSFLTCASLVGVIFMLPFLAWEVATTPAPDYTPSSIGAIVYLAVFPSIVSYLCWNAAVKRIGPNAAAFFNPTIPAFGTLWAIVFLGEQVHLYHLAGFALVIAGVLLSSKR